MWVEDLSSSSKSKATNNISRVQRKSTNAILDLATRLRQSDRHLHGLEKDNYNDVRVELSKTTGLKKKQQNQITRKIINSRKVFAHHLDEVDKRQWHEAVVTKSTLPARRFCATCGYWARYSCQKCGVSSCSGSCVASHGEAGCHRYS